MQMTTDHLLANPCDDEEDNMAMLCCHTNTEIGRAHV